jgi:hypothetical protein
MRKSGVGTRRHDGVEVASTVIQDMSRTHDGRVVPGAGRNAAADAILTVCGRADCHPPCHVHGILGDPGAIAHTADGNGNGGHVHDAGRDSTGHGRSAAPAFDVFGGDTGSGPPLGCTGTAVTVFTSNRTGGSFPCGGPFMVTAGTTPGTAGCAS